MAKKKSKKRKNNSRILLYIALTLALIATILSAVVIGYYFGFIDTKEEPKQIKKVHKKPITKKELSPSVNSRLKAVLKKEAHKPKEPKEQFISASHEVDYKEKSKIPKPLPRPIQVSPSKPKLAIIIDDVATKAHVKAINSLHLVLTKSFLPPRAARPHTPELAAHEKFYMVHLPMEAMHFSAEEPKTLRVTDSEEKIYKRIDEIKKLFPAVRFINNHTGSKFTSNEIAMNRLIFALNANHIHFIDSRTTAKTMAPKVLKNFGLKYVARDVFLDHHMDKPYVLKQIKKAIAVAKARGHAIVIGHPHKNTLQALYESKKLFKDVDLVQVNQIY